jgi:4-diphosphocytidyl-2-C-methyl-D-erythritol kinase
MKHQHSSHIYEIALARPEHVAPLPDLEFRAAQLYRGHGISDEILAGTSDVEALHEAQQAGLLWVALDEGGQPVGFAFVEEFDGGLYLSELDVLPEHGRRGLGRALVTSLLSFADEQQQHVLLSTFSDIPWNAPFYATLGFIAVDPTQYTPGMQMLRLQEQRKGLPLERRVLMLKAVAGSQ